MSKKLQGVENPSFIACSSLKYIITSDRASTLTTGYTMHNTNTKLSIQVVCRRVPWVRVGYTCGGRRVRQARVDGFFFSKPYLIRLIPVPVAGTRVRVRGYSGTGRRVRVREFFFLLHFLFYKYFCFAVFFPAGSAGTGIDLM
jgi:hypothetical protein